MQLLKILKNTAKAQHYIAKTEQIKNNQIVVMEIFNLVFVKASFQK
jgi:hypothetical protein